MDTTHPTRAVKIILYKSYDESQSTWKTILLRFLPSDVSVFNRLRHIELVTRRATMNAFFCFFVFDYLCHGAEVLYRIIGSKG